MKRFIAYARLGDRLICQAEGPNKKEAQTKAADMAPRLEMATAQVHYKQTHEQTINNGQTTVLN